ncbi:MAG: chromate efflux transporter [Thalassovita sp.]
MQDRQSSNPFKVFLTFLRLGLTSFGGPIAHLGYFREEFVARRQWLSEQSYAELVALCQFLPGPASSQVGFALGWMRGGALGGLAAFIGFTLPSALIMAVFALVTLSLADPVFLSALAGLKLVAVAIVSQAVLGMARSLCPDAPRASIAVVALAVLAVVPAPFAMPGAILLGALAGLFLQTENSAEAPLDIPVSRRVAVSCLILCAGLLVGLPLVAGHSATMAQFDSFFRAGALVFGGGHVVLPLLEAEFVPELIDHTEFLAGYSAAQAIPGPLFTFGTYLGALLGGATGAVLATVAIFLPGFLLLIGVLPFWQAVKRQPLARAALAGTNAAVVGILGAALFDPIARTALHDLTDLALAALCFVLLTGWRLPIWSVVVIGAAGGIVLGL